MASIRRASPGSRAQVERRRARLLSLDLDAIFRELNRRHWRGRIRPTEVTWSTRLRVAGQCLTPRGPIVLGLRYHLHYPRDLRRTLKHEMVHLLHWSHDEAFMEEARRVGALLYAQEYPGIRWPVRYVYECPSCGFRYRTRKRIHLACARCGGGNYRVKYEFKLVRVLA